MSEISRDILLQKGVQHGHYAKHWSPDFKPFLMMKVNGKHVINVDQTLKHLKTAGEELKKITGTGKKVLFIGRKTQAKNIIVAVAERLNQPYVTERWLGGTLTNFATIRKLLRKLVVMEQHKENETYIHLTKKEKLIIDRKKEKLNLLLHGMVMLNHLPDAVFVVDVNRENTAVKEAYKLGIPVFAIVDSNASSRFVNYPIPGNDDAYASIEVLVNYIASKIEEGNALWEEVKKERQQKHIKSVPVKENKQQEKASPKEVTIAKEATNTSQSSTAVVSSEKTE